MPQLAICGQLGGVLSFMWSTFMGSFNAILTLRHLDAGSITGSKQQQLKGHNMIFQTA